jgi:hypothetical protein
MAEVSESFQFDEKSALVFAVFHHYYSMALALPKCSYVS